MYVKSVELDGFKSYMRKANIIDFDKEFNAITGYNGSGKSNILDGICFLLGIVKLDSIRAKSLNDLVFKQGQAGITKASVTITFDNSDKSRSPLGYANYDEIVVRRVVAINGRSGYTINGVSMQNNRVADFFRGIGLNVNNPHFLIMQGRISTTLKMKPLEILALIEEAAGTKMYDQKRKESHKIIANKESKLKEVQNILDHDISPQMERMKEDRKTLIEYNRVKKNSDSMKKKLTAYSYYTSMQLELHCNAEAQKHEEEIVRSEASIVDLHERIEDKEKKLAELEAKDKEDAKYAELEEKLKTLTEERLVKEGECDELKAAKKQMADEVQRKALSIEKDTKARAKKAQELERIKNEDASAAEQCKKDDEEVTRLRAEMEALAKGLMTNDVGETMSVEARIQESRTEAADIEAALKTSVTRRDRLGPQIKELREKYDRQAKQQSKEMQEMKQREDEVQKSERELKKINFNEDRNDTLKVDAERLRQDIEVIKTNMSGLYRKYPKYEFTYTNPTPDFDREKNVFGSVVTLFSVKDPKYAYAIEIAAGHFINQVVVSTQDVARQLVSHGNLTTRRTIIPVRENRARGNNPRLENARFFKARDIGAKHNETVIHALDLIEYPAEMKTIFENIFGCVLVCDTLACAKEIAYDRAVLARTVTLRGDDVKPKGTMSGGYTDTSRSYALADFRPFLDWRNELKEKKTQLAAVEDELTKTEVASKRYFEMKGVLENARSRLEAIRENLHSSELGIIEKDMNAAQAEYDKIAVEVKERKDRMTLLKKLVHDLESRKNNEKDFQENEKRKVKEKLNTVEKRLEKNRFNAENAVRLINGVGVEIEQLAEQVARDTQYIDAKKVELQELERQIAGLQEAIDEIGARGQKAREKVEAERKLMREHDEESKRLMKAVDSHKREIQKIRGSIEKLKKEKERSLEEVQVYKIKAARIKKKNEWVEAEYPNFNKKNTEYDFTSFSEEKGKNMMAELDKEVADLGRKVNPRVTTMLESAETKVAELGRKVAMVFDDKKMLLKTIDLLDDRRNSEIERAYTAVNNDFGKIFSTLLPGANAKLKKVNPTCLSDGLEFEVAFNGQWKDSLNELSGGQRSLVALSLLLAMLKFNPAPLYILDEVDAALDLSHTANIGKMIRTHFKDSQFIVVSLKEGMFSNANVIFQARFIDGSSEVIRRH